MAGDSLSFYPGGFAPAHSDSPAISLKKINALLNQLATMGIPILTGHGSPEGVVTANIGTLYVDLDTGNLYKKVANNGGNTGWV